ncbi:MAG: ABC transporter permease [Pseudomonadota bacterium]
MADTSDRANSLSIDAPADATIDPFFDQDDPVLSTAPESRVWKKFRSHGSAVFGGILVAFFVVIALLAPILPIADPIATDWGAVRQAPSWAHPLGTDEIGRDVLSRMVWGAQASLLAGVVSVAIAVTLGVPLGIIAGYFGGWTDAVISRCTEALLAAPFLILAIALAAFLGPSLTNAMIAIGISATPIFIRLTRGQVLSVKAEDYVEGAQAIGLSTPRILTRYIFPNVFPPVLVQATLTIATAIIAEASLSFLGLGQQPPAPSWGSMLNTAKNFLTQAPWMALWPGIAIFLVVLGFNLLGDGLRDALDPRET